MSKLSPSEAAQLGQTIEMFEVITQSQPQDYQSLEILKEAYSKLGREPDVIKTSKRIAEAYVQLEQSRSAHPRAGRRRFVHPDFGGQRDSAAGEIFESARR